MNNKGSGFTLIELIIAISILSMLLLTGSLVYSTIANRWDKELGNFEQTFSEFRSMNMMDTLMKGVMPYVILDDRNKTPFPTMFFVGHEDSLLAVTRNGLTSDFPEIVRLTVSDNPEGGVDLIYQARSTRNMVLLTSQQAIDFDHEFTLLSDFEEIQFSYYGHESFQVKNNYVDTEGQPDPVWKSQYSGLDARLNPIKIRIDLRKENKVLHLEADLDPSAQRFIEHYVSAREEQG